MNHSDHITHINNLEDHIYLKSKLFPVNMRIFNTSTEYRDLILHCCDHIEFFCKTKMNGYKKPHGMSGANCAIPFNIIAYMENRDKKNEKCIVMINPRIISYFGNEIISESNCGSLTLENPIKIRRAEEILIRYFDTSGIERDRYINRESGSLTIQHEVDHNNGILITDRQ